MIRRQLESFIKNEDNNTLGFVVKSTKSSKITLTFLEAYEIDVNILNNMQFSCSSSDKDLELFVKKVNEFANNGNKSLAVHLQKMNDFYAENFLGGLTPQTSTKTVTDELFDSESPSPNVNDDEEDGEDDFEFSFDGEETPANVYIDESVFETPKTQTMKDRQQELLRSQHQKMFEKTKNDIKVSGIVKSMVSSAKKDYKKRKAQCEIFVTFYTDGFEVNRDGNLRSLNEEKNKKMFASLQKGFVPNELNPKRYTEIDCHVIWKSCKFADRDKNEKSFNPSSFGREKIGKEFSQFKDKGKRLGGGEWYCGGCSMKNSGGAKCNVCGTKDGPAGINVTILELHWDCERCALRNAAIRNYCRICGNKKGVVKMGQLESGSNINVETKPIESESKEKKNVNELNLNDLEDELKVDLSGKKYECDKSKETTRIKLRYPDGSSEVLTINTSSKVGELLDHIMFVVKKEFVLSVAFPKKVIKNREESIDKAGLKNSNLIVKEVD